MDPDLYLELPAVERVRARIDHVSASARTREDRATSERLLGIPAQLDPAADELRMNYINPRDVDSPNGNEEKGLGNPQSSARPTWFIVPDELAPSVREAIDRLGVTDR